ncbi:Minor allergen Cla h [Hortaea werneckii]|nr:Minor allergen Cla h [Hortaea werneckii]
MAPKIAIVFYSTWGHIKTIAQKEAEGIKSAGGTCDLYQIPETLPEEVLTKMHAPPKDSSIPTLEDPATLEQYDAFLLGIPTRYGNFPAQWKAFWDKTGGQWQNGAYWGKYAGVFVSTASQGGGQESTVIAAMSTLAHHGIIYVPLGYKTTFGILADMSEVRGGSAWGAGTFAAADGSRQPSQKELDLAIAHGKQFYEAVNRVNFAKSNPPRQQEVTPAQRSLQVLQALQAVAKHSRHPTALSKEKKTKAKVPVFARALPQWIDIRASHSAISVPHSRSNSADDIEMKNCTLLITIPRYVPINAHA